MLKSTLVATALALSVAAGAVTPSFAQETYKQELKEHPRLVKAIIDLEDAIAYMEKAPHDFGGHKAKAIADARAAVVQLKEAIKFRVRQDNKR